VWVPLREFKLWNSWLTVWQAKHERLCTEHQSVNYLHPSAKTHSPFHKTTGNMGPLRTPKERDLTLPTLRIPVHIVNKLSILNWNKVVKTGTKLLKTSTGSIKRTNEFLCRQLTPKRRRSKGHIFCFFLQRKET